MVTSTTYGAPVRVLRLSSSGMSGDMAGEEISAEVIQCPLRIARRSYIVAFDSLSLGRVALALSTRLSLAIYTSPVE